jgi:O-antigen/teichoic acid export membrane protein
MPRWKSSFTNLATLGARLSTTAALVIVNGVAARRLSHQQLGLWMILLAINQFTNGLDLGFQFTLGNRLAALGSRGLDGERERRETFLSILFLQVFIFALESLIVLLVVPSFPWVAWFKITDPVLIGQVVPLMPAILIVMIGTLPVGLIWTVFFAYHEIKLASFLTAGANLIQVVAFVIAAYLCKFASIIFIYYASNIVLGTVLTAYLLVRRKWQFTFLPVRRIIEIVRSMVRVSSYAFFHTISSIILAILGPILSGGLYGLAGAADFWLLQKLFSFLTTAHLAILAPVAPAVTLESHSGNWDAVSHRLRTCIWQVWPAFFVIAGGMVWYAHPFIIQLWAGYRVKGYTLAGLLLLWACLTGFVNTYSVFLNSLGLVKIQSVLSMVMILPSILIPVLMSRWLGLSGVALGFAVCTLPAAIIWPFYTRRALRLHLLRV